MLTRDDFKQIREIIKEEVQSEVDPIKKQLVVATRKINRLQKDMTFIVKDYGNAVSHLRKKVDRIEEHLDLPQI